MKKSLKTNPGLLLQQPLGWLEALPGSTGRPGGPETPRPGNWFKPKGSSQELHSVIFEATLPETTHGSGMNTARLLL